MIIKYIMKTESGTLVNGWIDNLKEVRYPVKHPEIDDDCVNMFHRDNHKKDDNVIYEILPNNSLYESMCLLSDEGLLIEKLW